VGRSTQDLSTKFLSDIGDKRMTAQENQKWASIINARTVQKVSSMRVNNVNCDEENVIAKKK